MAVALQPKEIAQLTRVLLAEDEYTDLALLFKMFADPTRLRIFTILAEKEVCVDDLASILGMSQSAVSHQLSSLRKVDLVRGTKIGQQVFYQLSDSHVMTIFKQALDHVRE